MRDGDLIGHGDEPKAGLSWDVVRLLNSGCCATPERSSLQLRTRRQQTCETGLSHNLDALPLHVRAQAGNPNLALGGTANPAPGPLCTPKVSLTPMASVASLSRSIHKHPITTHRMKPGISFHVHDVPKGNISQRRKLHLVYYNSTLALHYMYLHPISRGSINSAGRSD